MKRDREVDALASPGDERLRESRSTEASPCSSPRSLPGSSPLSEGTTPTTRRDSDGELSSPVVPGAPPSVPRKAGLTAAMVAEPGAQTTMGRIGAWAPRLMPSLVGFNRAPQRSPPPEASTEGAPPVAMDAPTSSALRAFDMLAVGGRHGGPAPSLPPSPPSPGLFFGRVLTSPVYSGIVIAFCALLVANQWGPAGDEGSIVNVATLMLVVVAVYVVIKFLPALRASAPQCLIWGMPIASLFTCIYDASQPESNTTAAHGLAQFANAPMLSMAGQVMLGVLLGTQPLPVRSRFVGVVLSIALWELNLLLVSQRTGNLAYLTALLPQTAAPLFSGHVIGVLTARVLVQRKVAGATTLEAGAAETEEVFHEEWPNKIG